MASMRLERCAQQAEDGFFYDFRTGPSSVVRAIPYLSAGFDAN